MALGQPSTKVLGDCHLVPPGPVCRSLVLLAERAEKREALRELSPGACRTYRAAVAELSPG
jgi:hypothetical protein